VSRSGRLVGGLILTALLLAGGWYGLRQFQRSSSDGYSLVSGGTATLPPFSFTDIDGATRHSSEWGDKALVVNFWATWCPPCRREMPLLVEMQQQYRNRGVQFVGIAIDDPDLARDFHDVYEINFPTLIGGPEAIQLATTLGNRFGSLPFTAIFDAAGNTRYIQAGELTRSTLLKQIDALTE